MEPDMIKTPKERDTLDLLELVCQLHHRALILPDNEKMHQNYKEARKELENRLILPTGAQEPAILCVILKYEIANTWWCKLMRTPWLQKFAGTILAIRTIRKYNRSQRLKDPENLPEIYEAFKELID